MQLAALICFILLTFFSAFRPEMFAAFKFKMLSDDVKCC